LSQQALLRGEVDMAEDQQLGAAERSYYSNMCNQLFQRYNSIKARGTEGKKCQVSQWWFGQH